MSENKPSGTNSTNDNHRNGNETSGSDLILLILKTKCYYQKLGVTKTASSEEIKKAYRKRCLKVHPDRNPGNTRAEAAFKSLTEAHSTLSDESKRASYDNFGPESERQDSRLNQNAFFR